jgi:hypothetical protein
MKHLITILLLVAACGAEPICEEVCRPVCGSSGVTDPDGSPEVLCIAGLEVCEIECSD